MAIGMFSGSDKDDYTQIVYKFDIRKDIKHIKNFKTSNIVDGCLIVEEVGYGRVQIRVFCYKEGQERPVYIAYHEAEKTLYLCNK